MTYISMSQKDLYRYDVIQRSTRKEITVSKAGELLGLSERQTYRLRAKVKQSGPQGLIHANRGKPSNHRIPELEHQKIVRLLRKHYYDFKPTHAQEKLEEKHSISRDPKTIRQIMIEQGLWKPRKQRKAEYRARRARKEYYGEMEQFDGSYEHWFEDRASSCCLLASIDDATSIVTQAQFVQDEGIFPVFTFWQEYLLTNGKPRSIYLDKLRTYYNNHPSALDDKEMLTQFQRAMRELGIKPITAHSPQAKGRIERLFNTFQDRLIKELRLKKISDIKTANQFLKQEFLPWFNAKYTIEPAKRANLHYKLNKKEQRRLESVLSRQSERTVSNDFIIRFDNRWYQLTKEQSATIRPKEKVMIEERLDGSVWLRLRGKYLSYVLLATKPKKQNNQPWIIAASQKKERKPYKPSKDHPWRKYPVILPSPSREKVAVN